MLVLACINSLSVLWEEKSKVSVSLRDSEACSSKLDHLAAIQQAISDRGRKHPVSFMFRRESPLPVSCESHQSLSNQCFQIFIKYLEQFINQFVIKFSTIYDCPYLPCDTTFTPRRVTFQNTLMESIGKIRKCTKKSFV